VVGVYICGKAKQAFGESWALPEVVVEQRQSWNTKTSLKAETQTVVEVPCKARTLLRGWSKHASQVDWESGKDPDSTQSRSK